jgi:hypothetical protein
MKGSIYFLLLFWLMRYTLCNIFSCSSGVFRHSIKFVFFSSMMKDSNNFSVVLVYYEIVYFNLLRSHEMSTAVYMYFVLV